MKRIVITGGAGFIGSSLAIAIRKHFASANVTVFDNLLRHGSELNLKRLEKYSIEYVHGDVRSPNDLNMLGDFDFMLECSAEPSVLSGYVNGPREVFDINLGGLINCAELCREKQAGILFLSTSRVYPVNHLEKCQYAGELNRFILLHEQSIPGVSENGISEDFPLNGHRSYYGASKLSGEIILEEYRHQGMPVIINRCGVVAGPWQFGRVDQGIATFWLASHILERPLKYIGFGGQGKQVRDILHIDDLTKLVMMQLDKPEKYGQSVFNVGGGGPNSVSLKELTMLCSDIVGKQTQITPDHKPRPEDIPIYISDCKKISGLSGWQPEKSVSDIINDTNNWIRNNPNVLDYL